jgi:hypothetical protein
MKILVAATALAVAASFLCVPAEPAQAQSYSKEQANPHKIKKAKNVKKAKKTTQRVVRYGSPYSTNPAHDVYVNGVYVGSDPDPRIRWTLKKEYCEDSVDGCGY